MGEEAIIILGMVARSITIVLNRPTTLPFFVDDESAFAHVFLPYYGGNYDMIVDDDFVQTDTWEKMNVAKLTLHNVTARAPWHNPRGDWWDLSVVYTVTRTLSSRPVFRESILTKINRHCQSVLNDSLNSNYFWDALRSISFGDQSLVLNAPYYNHDKGLADLRSAGSEYDLTNWYCSINEPSSSQDGSDDKDGTTAADALPVGKKNWKCGTDNGRPQQPLPLCATVHAGSPKGDSVKTNNEKRTACCCCESPPSSATENPSPYDGMIDTSNATYGDVIADSPLQVVWSTREYFGLGLLSATIILIVTTSSIAHVISKRRDRQRLWGAALTKEGVDELLQVGWRYHEQQLQMAPVSDDGELGAGHSGDPGSNRGGRQQHHELQQPQLFLQVYDKGIGPGYNEENSMLRGGVEQINEFDFFRSARQAPPVSTTAPTSSTPPPTPSRPKSNVIPQPFGPAQHRL